MSIRKVKAKKIYQKTNAETQYISADILHSSCYEDYKHILDTYDKLYDKINIALGFCGVILLVVLSSFDYSLFFVSMSDYSKMELFYMFARIVCSSMSAICIIWAVIQLLLLMRSQQLTVFDSCAIRNDEIYNLPHDQAALWLIDKYTLAISELRTTVSSKQKKVDSAIVKIVISILTYAIVLVMQKGV